MAVTGTEIFTAVNRVGPTNSHGPQIDFDSAGNLWVILFDSDGLDFELWYSSDDGANWSQWGTLDASPATNSPHAFLYITDEDQLFTITPDGNGTQQLHWIDINTTTPGSSTEVTATSINQGSAGSAFVDMRAFAHPDSAGDHIVMLLQNDDSNSRLGVRAVEATGGTTLTDNGVVWFESSNANLFDTGVFFGVKAAKNARTPSTPSSPDILVKFMEDDGLSDFPTYVIPGSWDSTNDRWTAGTASGELEDPGMHLGFILPDDDNSCWYLIGVERITQKWQVIKYTYSGTATVLTDSGTFGSASMAGLRAFWVQNTIHCIAYEYGGDSVGYNVYDTDTDSWSGWTTILTGSDITGLTGITNPEVSVAPTYDANGKVHAIALDNTTSDLFWVHLYTVDIAETITDPALSASNTLFTDGFAHILSDPALSDADTLYVDVLEQKLVISDPALTDGDTLYVDVLDATRYITDPALTDTDTLHVDGLGREANFSPYWRWRFVRQNGQLYTIPAKSAQAWTGAEVVSSDFRFSSDAQVYIQEAATTAWAAHSGSSAATLKAAIDTALGSFGIRDMEGNVLT